MKYGHQLLNKLEEAPLPPSAVIEIKEDGDKAVWEPPALINRGLRRVEARFPEIVPHLPKDAHLDIEVCVFRDGLSLFEDGIQKRGGLDNRAEIRLRAATHPCTAVVHDILELRGKVLADQPFVERRKALEALAQELGWPIYAGLGAGTPPPPFPVVVPRQWPIGDLEAMQRLVREKDMEGLVIKDLTALWKATRNSGQLKWKAWVKDDFQVLRHELTSGDRREGFVIYVALPTGEEQRVVVNDRGLQNKVSNGAKQVTIEFLESSKKGRLRQPHVLEVSG